MLAITSEISERIGDPQGVRILHVSDLHNRSGAFFLTARLARSVSASVVVNTGDLSGIGGPLERFLLSRWLKEWPLESVVALGNHDSAATAEAVRKAGGSVLSPDSSVQVAGITFWGYRDPNRTRLVIGPRYDPSLCEQASNQVEEKTSSVPRPFVIAVHNELMVGRPPPGCPLVLCGHFHSPRVRKLGTTLYVRAGTTGGRSKRSKEMHFAILDLARDTLEANSVWLLEVDGLDTKVTEVQV